MLFLLFTTLFIGCKDEKSVDSLDVVKPEIVDNSFKVTLDVVVKKDDDLSLFYTEDGSIDFKSEPIWIGIKGSNVSQKVVYTLPEGVYPTQIRLDFGMNKAQEDITLNSVTMEYKGKSKRIGCPEFVSLFRADDSKCSFDPLTGLIKAKVVDGIRRYPSLYPHESMLGPEIIKLAK